MSFQPFPSNPTGVRRDAGPFLPRPLGGERRLELLQARRHVEHAVVEQLVEVDPTVHAHVRLGKCGLHVRDRWLGLAIECPYHLELGWRWGWGEGEGEGVG